MSLQFNINQLQQCSDISIGTPSVGDVITVTSTSPLQFDLAPGGGGGGGVVNSIIGLTPITVDDSTPSAPKVGVLEADGNANQPGVVSDGTQTFNGRKNFLNVPSCATLPGSVDDLVNKQYVDTVAAGLSVRAAVRAATLVPGTLASSFKDGEIIDGVTLVDGDRILIKNQTNQIENGIYTVNVSGAPSRAADYNDPGEANAGTFTTVIAGGQANTQWVQVNTGNPTPGTNALSFSQLAISGNVNAVLSPNTSHGTSGTLKGIFSLDTTDIYYNGNTGDDLKTRLDSKAPLDAPSFTGNATSTNTPGQGNNSFIIANTAYVDTGLATKQGTLPSQGGNAGKYLYTNGSVLSWASGNAGTVTSVSGTGGASGLTLSGTVTSTGNITLGGTLSVIPGNFASQTQNTVLAAPNGSSGTPAFRSLVAADIPTIPLSVPANETGTTYTYVLGDANNVFKRFSNAASITVTVPPSSSVNYPIGTQLYGIQVNTGRVTISQGVGVTINAADASYPGTPAKTRVQYSSFMLVKVGTDTWDLVGDLSVV